MTRPDPLFLVLLFLGAFAMEPAPAAELVPHRAAYSIKMASASAKSGLVDARGLMVLEWAESCDRWTVQQKTRFEFTQAEGPVLQTETNFTSWEARDGLEYGFSLRSDRGGVTIEDLRGTAQLKERMAGGTARLTRPTGLKRDLAAGTMFPTTHAVLLIDSAVAGKKRLSRLVFLGQREDDPMEVSALITPATAEDRKHVMRKLATSDGEAASALLKGPAWRVRMAFFATGSEAVAPEFEVDEVLYANGIAADVKVEYEDFLMIYSLERVEPLPKPAC